MVLRASNCHLDLPVSRPVPALLFRLIPLVLPALVCRLRLSFTLTRGLPPALSEPALSLALLSLTLFASPVWFLRFSARSALVPLVNSPRAELMRCPLPPRTRSDLQPVLAPCVSSRSSSLAHGSRPVLSSVIHSALAPLVDSTPRGTHALPVHHSISPPARSSLGPRLLVLTHQLVGSNQVTLAPLANSASWDTRNARITT